METKNDCIQLAGQKKLPGASILQLFTAVIDSLAL